MGFKSFLSKIGAGAKWALGIAQQLPDNRFSSIAEGVLGKIAVAVSAAELTSDLLGAAKGGEAKMGAVAPIAEVILRSSELVAGREIVDEAAFAEGARLVTEGVIKIQKSLKVSA